MRLDEGVCSRWFVVERELRQGCVLAPLLFNIFFVVIMNVDIMDALVHLRKKTGAGGRGEATAGEPVLATPLWSMLYTDETGVVPQSPEDLRKMIGVIMVVCAVFSLTISEAKTEIICLRTKGVSEATTIFSVEAAGQGVQPNKRVRIPRENVNHNADLPIEVGRGAYVTHGAASGGTPSNCTTNLTSPSSLKYGC